MKRLNYYLGIVVLLIITIVSCRNEIFTEKTEQIDPNAILFKSNVVSLSQSKHRNKLLPEISATKKKLSNAKYKTSNGKIINFGDISLDTDHVVYIENGQNYHNYIFKITRENGTENLPLENILFTPLPDGSYKEFLISYNITQQERQALEQGIWRVPKERITINEIKKGTYSNTIFQKTSSETCNWVAVDTYTFCSANVHFHGEGYPDCTAEIKSQLVTTFVLKCESVDDGSSTSGGGTSSGGTWEGGTGDTDGTQDGGTDGSGGGTSPCSGTGIYTQPQDPSYSTGDCEDGVPLLPNLGIGSPHAAPTPCDKTNSSINKANNLLKNPQVQTNVDAVLKAKTQSSLEYAKKIGKNSDGTYSFSQLVEGTKDMTTLTNVSLPSGDYVGDGHSHAGGNGDPSAGDFYGMLEQLVNNSYFETRFVYGDYFGTPEVYALVLNDRKQALDFLTNYPRASNYDTSSRSFLRNSIVGDDFWEANDLHHSGTALDSSGENYVSPAIGMAYILEKYNVGISLAKADANGNLKKINASLEEIEVPFSGGARKKGVKITKCP